MTPPGLEEYFASWADPLPSRTKLPELLDEERIRERIAASGDLALRQRIDYLPAGI